MALLNYANANSGYNLVPTGDCPSPAAVVTAIATYRPDQWEELLASAADREILEDTWEEWNEGLEKLIAGLEARSRQIGKPIECKRVVLRKSLSQLLESLDATPSRSARYPRDTVGNPSAQDLHRLRPELAVAKL